MARLGMDADAVERVGRELGSTASQMQRVVTDIDRLVGSLPGQWLGPSVTQYMNLWQGSLRRQTVGCAEQVAGLGRKALDNAAEQRRVSGTLDGGGGGGGGGGISWPGVAAAVAGGAGIAKSVLSAPKHLAYPLKAQQYVRNYNRLAAQGKLEKLADWKKVFKIDGRNVVGRAGELLGKPENWDDVPKAMSRLAKDHPMRKVFDLMPEGSGAAKLFGGVGKALGPLGVGLNAYSAYEAFAEGNTGRGVYNSAMTVLSAAALLPIPPVNAIAGGVAGAMYVGQLVYDNWGAITDFVSNPGEKISGAYHAVTNKVSDVAKSVGSALNPGNWFK